MFYATKAALLTVLSILIVNSYSALADEIPDYKVISEQCEMETLALVNNTAIQAIEPQTLTCLIDFTVTNMCTADYMTVSAEFERVCLQEGGQIYTQDMHWDCNVEDPTTGKKYNGDYYFLNFPSCFGFSCNTTELAAEFEATIFPLAEQQLATQGFQCDVKVATSGGFMSRSINPQFYYGIFTALVFVVPSIGSFL